MTFDRDPNKPPTKADLQQYIHKYKLEAQRDANTDMDKLFEQANQLEQKLSSDLIVFASVVLTIMGGIIAAREINLSLQVKLVLAVGFVTLLISILAGLLNYRSMSGFWLKWAIAKHERGGIIELDKSKTYDDLVNLRKKMADHEAELPQTSPKLFSRIQIVSFVVGVMLVTLAIIGIMFDFGFLRNNLS